MIFVLDGYNVLHAIPAFEKELRTNLRGAREFLIRVCAELRSRRRDIEEIVIVFDGSSNVSFPGEPRPAGVRVIYTKSREDADDRILEILKSFAPSKAVTVVSNDNYVANNVRASAVKMATAAEFYALVEKKKDPVRGKGTGPADSKLPSHLASRITAEYKKFLGIE